MLGLQGYHGDALALCGCCVVRRAAAPSPTPWGCSGVRLLLLLLLLLLLRLLRREPSGVVTWGLGRWGRRECAGCAGRAVGQKSRRRPRPAAGLHGPEAGVSFARRDGDGRQDSSSAAGRLSAFQPCAPTGTPAMAAC